MGASGVWVFQAEVDHRHRLVRIVWQNLRLLKRFGDLSFPINSAVFFINKLSQ